MHALKWSSQARADLLTIIDYIANDNLDAAQRLKDEINHKVTKLLAHPKLYKIGRVNHTREMLVRSNYVVIYSEQQETIKTLRVLHVARQFPVI